MTIKLKIVCSALILALTTGCSAYKAEDLHDANATNKASSCVNMDPAQEMKCREREQSLILGGSTNGNCNHPYDYESNRCKREQAEQAKALDQALKKHTKQ